MATPKQSPAVARAQRAGVRDVLAQVSAEMEGLDVESMRALVPALAEAEREVAEKLGAWLARHGGDERFTTQQLRNALANIRGAMDKIRQLDPVAAAALVQQRNVAAAMAAKHVERELAAFSALFEGTARPISLDVAAVFARGEAMLLRRFASSRDRYKLGTRIAADIQKQLAVGVASGESFEQLTQRLIKLGGPRGLVATRGIAGQRGAIVEQINEGLFKRHENFAERLVRTEGIEAYNTFADESIREAGFEDPTIGRRWDDTGDVRECPICRGLRGVVVGVDQDFPGGIDRPPAHPNCRCAVIAWSSRWKEAREGVSFPFGTPQPARRPGSEQHAQPAGGVQQPLVFPSRPQPLARGVRPLPTVASPPKTTFTTTAPPAKPKRVPVEGFDAEQLAKALGASPRPIGHSKNKFEIAGATGKTLRDETRKLVESFGLESRDRNNVASHDKLDVWRSLPGAYGSHGWDGSIRLREERFVGAQRFMRKIVDDKSSEIVGSEARGMRTLVHETTHGTSPLPPAAYATHVGAAVEEVTVEAHARRVLRERFPGVSDLHDVQFPRAAIEVDLASRSSYDSWMHHMRRLVEEQLGHDADSAIRAIEEAAVRMRAPGVAKEIAVEPWRAGRGESKAQWYRRSARAYVEHFVEHVPMPTAPTASSGVRTLTEDEKRKNLIDAIERGAWQRWKGSPHA